MLPYREQKNVPPSAKREIFAFAKVKFALGANEMFRFVRITAVEICCLQISDLLY